MDLTLAVGLAASLHLGLEGNYNEAHPHARVSASSFIAGAYYNSESAVSAYAGYRLEGGPAYLEVGAVTGYSAAPLAPFVRAGIQLSPAVSVFAAPALEKDPDNLGAVFGIEYMIRVK